MGLQRIGALLFGVGLLAATVLAVVPGTSAFGAGPLVRCSAVPWLPGCSGSVGAHPAVFALAVAIAGLLVGAVGIVSGRRAA